MDKKDIRKSILAKREQMEPKEVADLSELICKKVLATDDYKNAENILAYVAFRNEVDIWPVINAALSEGKNVYLPRTISSTEMVFLKYEKDQVLIEGRFGVREPAASSEAFAKGNGLMIMPGVAFDKNHNRIGYGGGFYDRYLQNGNIKKMAVAFENQIVPSIQNEKTDIKVNIIVSESQIY